jgi:hypothetical protein
MEILDAESNKLEVGDDVIFTCNGYPTRGWIYRIKIAELGTPPRLLLTGAPKDSKNKPWCTSWKDCYLLSYIGTNLIKYKTDYVIKL